MISERSRINFLAIVVASLSLIPGFLFIGRHADDFIYLVPYGWWVEITPLIYAGCIFVILRAVLRTAQAFNFYDDHRVVKLFYYRRVATVVLLFFATLPTVIALNASFLDRVEVVNNGIKVDQLSEVSSMAEKELGFNMIVYWDRENLCCVFLRHNGRPQTVRNVLISIQRNAIEINQKH